MFVTKKALAAERKEEKAARWNELKFMKDEKLRAKLMAEVRKVKRTSVHLRMRSLQKRKGQRGCYHVHEPNHDGCHNKEVLETH